MRRPAYYAGIIRYALESLLCSILCWHNLSRPNINVPYRSDAVLVNLGALMQNWTSDIYRASVRLYTYLSTSFQCDSPVS